MSLLPEVAEKFQFDTDLFMEALKERVQELFPFLAPDDQQNMPIMQSDNVFATCLVRADSKICSDHPSAPYTQLGVIYRVDVSAKNGIASISDFQNLGRAADDGASYTEELTQRLMDDINEWFTTEHFFIHPLQSGHCYFKFQTYNPNMMLSLRYGDPEVESVNQTPIRSIKRDNTYVDSNENMCYVQLNAVEYSINAQGKVQTTMDSFYMLQTEYTLHGLKGYPVIMHCDNDYYINKYITDNGAVNNYTGTYTTPGGKTINLYYGDNYIITNVQDNEPVSYNDVKNALTIAVNQINDDNDIDLKVPDFIPDIEDDNQYDGGVYGPADFCHIYACTQSELDNLQKWMSGGAAGSSGDSPVTVPDNFDPMAQIVGLIGYPIEIDTGVGDDTTFTFRSADNQTVNTGWATKKLGIVEREIDMGTVTVTPWGKEKKKVPWLDYSATVECYIPFCGMVPLDPQSVMGQTLTCKMWVCFATGDVSAIVYSDINGGQHPVAYASGNCGASQPISAAAFGSLMGARAAADHKMTQAVLGGVKNAVTGTVNTAVANYARGAGQFNLPVPAGQGSGLASQIANAGGMIMGSKYGAMSAITSAVDLGVNLTLQNLDNRYNYTVAKNSLGTTIAGSFGQMTSWHYENHCYIKVTWPTPMSDRVTNYGRTYGVPVHKSGTVGDYSGYTVCNNVDCSGITKATVSEQALIKQYLESGVYVNGGES